MQRRNDRIKDGFGSRQRVVIPEAQDAIAAGFQEPGACLVVRDTLRVLPAVQLDDQGSVRTDKIHGVWADRVLAAEFQPEQATVAEVEPYLRLCIGLTGAEGALEGVVLLSADRYLRTPHPGPLPAARGEGEVWRFPDRGARDKSGALRLAERWKRLRDELARPLVARRRIGLGRLLHVLGRVVARQLRAFAAAEGLRRRLDRPR